MQRGKNVTIKIMSLKTNTPNARKDTKYGESHEDLFVGTM